MSKFGVAFSSGAMASTTISLGLQNIDLTAIWNYNLQRICSTAIIAAIWKTYVAFREFSITFGRGTVLKSNSYDTCCKFRKNVV